MKDKTRKIIAWIGLIFMAAFIVSLMLSLLAPNLFGGNISYLALLCFLAAIVPFALIFFDNRARRLREEEENQEKQRRAENKRKRAENAEKQARENAEKAEAARKDADLRENADAPPAEENVNRATGDGQDVNS